MPSEALNGLGASSFAPVTGFSFPRAWTSTGIGVIHFISCWSVTKVQAYPQIRLVLWVPK